MLKLCDDIDTLSMMLCDGELADAELRDVELHMIDCAVCRAHVDRDRGFLGELRLNLVPPPTPEVVRQRLSRALDEVDRARRPSWRNLALPGAAAIAAAAALLVFVTMRDPAPTRTATTARTPTTALTAMQPDARRVGMATSAAYNVRDLAMQYASAERIGADVVKLSYWLIAPTGRRFAVYAFVHDAARLEVEPSARTMIDGYEVWQRPDGLVVKDGARAIQLSSPDLDLANLKAAISDTPLISRIIRDDARP